MYQLEKRPTNQNATLNSTDKETVTTLYERYCDNKQYPSIF